MVISYNGLGMSYHGIGYNSTGYNGLSVCHVSYTKVLKVLIVSGGHSCTKSS